MENQENIKSVTIAMEIADDGWGEGYDEGDLGWIHARYEKAVNRVVARHWPGAEVVLDIDYVSTNLHDSACITLPDGEEDGDEDGNFRQDCFDEFCRYTPKPATLPTLTCLRCGRTWHPQRDGRPGVCPECKSYDWDKPRRMPKA